jgi:hypothetical protein
MSSGVMTGNEFPHGSPVPLFTVNGDVEPKGDPIGDAAITSYSFRSIPNSLPCPTIWFHHPFSPFSPESTKNGVFDMDGIMYTSGFEGRSF